MAPPKQHSREPWTRGLDGPKVIKGKVYKDLVEFSRPCTSCKQPFSIFVTRKIADGQADSNSFGLKNCPEHRRNKTAAAQEETDALRMANNVMKAELEGLYARDSALFAEVQELKAKLAKYELQPAMAAMPLTLKMPWE
jgi:hypothetical protein